MEAVKHGDIIAKSEAFVKRQDFEGALALLMSVPEEVKCYSKIQAKSVDVFKAYQNQKCVVQIQSAKVSIAGNDLNLALEALRQIDPSSTCFNEAQGMMAKIASKISVEEKRQFELQLKVYNDRVALERQRINAIKEIASSYYKSRPTTVVYHYLVR